MRCMSAADEYDRYDYEHGESPPGERVERKPCQALKSCCNDMARLIKSFHRNFTEVIDAIMYSASH